MWRLNLFGFALAIVLTACGAGDPFEDPADRATREAAATQIAAEAIFAANQELTLEALEATVVQMTTLENDLQRLTNQNGTLQATLNPQAAIPPTAAVVATPVPAVNTTYRNTTTSTGVRDIDSCALDSVTQFAISNVNDLSEIYFTTVGQNVRANTNFSTRWYFGEELRYESATWAPDINYNEVCMYFFLQSSDTTYQSGQWAVELVADGVVATRTEFTMCLPNDVC